MDDYGVGPRSIQEAGMQMDNDTALVRSGERSLSLSRASALWAKVWLGFPGEDAQGDWGSARALGALTLFGGAVRASV